jgi:hypothetical protein
LRTGKVEWTSLASRYLGDISFGPLPDGGCTVVAMFEPGSMAKKLLGQFKVFCKLAGSHLPDRILKSHEGWPNDPVSRWLTFLWRVGVLNQKGLHGVVALTSDAFDASVRAIERCGLHTTSPAFPPPAPDQAPDNGGSTPTAKPEQGEGDGGPARQQRNPLSLRRLTERQSSAGWNRTFGKPTGHFSMPRRKWSGSRTTWETGKPMSG